MPGNGQQGGHLHIHAQYPVGSPTSFRLQGLAEHGVGANRFANVDFEALVCFQIFQQRLE